MKKSLIVSIIVAVISIVIIVAGCTSSTNPTTTSTDNSVGATAAKTDRANSNAVSVNIDNFAYQPSELTVKKGTTVTWINSDSVIHTVTSTNGRFTSSGDLGKDASHQAQFNAAGTYDYYCIPHPFMKGKIIVEE